MRSLEARLAYLQMEEILLKREMDRARDGISRYQMILSEQEALLDGVLTTIVNVQSVMDNAEHASQK